MDPADFQNLLNLIKLVGGKFIIVEEGKPQAVLMSYNEFSVLAAPAATEYLMGRMAKIEAAESVNQEIVSAQLQDLREEVILEEPEITIEPISPYLGRD